MECVKFIMFGFTVVFWLYGAAILGVGISLAVDPGAFDVLGAVGRAGMNNYLWAIAVCLFIVIGALAFLIGFSGCWIACISNSSFIPFCIYSALVGVITGEVIFVVTLTAIYWGSADDDVAKAMYNDVSKKYDDAILYDALYTSWNTMQMEWQCCGSYNYTDYKYSKYDENSEDPDVWIPESCCKDTTNSTNKDQCQKGNIQFIYNQEVLYSRRCCWETEFTWTSNEPPQHTTYGGSSGISTVRLVEGMSKRPPEQPLEQPSEQPFGRLAMQPPGQPYI